MKSPSSIDTDWPTGDQPLVSAIIPVFNRASVIGAAIESVLAQSYRNIEIIVVDDGSTDGSGRTAERFEGVRCLRQHNAGAASARNVGVDAATGEILAFLDSDDEWLPDKIARQVEFLTAHSSVGCVFVCERVVIDAPARPSWIEQHWLTTGRRAINVSSLVATRSAFERVGPFDKSLTYGEDTDWVLRARDAGVRMELIPEVHVLRHMHDENISLAKPPDHSAFLRVLRKSIHRKRSQRAKGGAL